MYFKDLKAKLCQYFPHKWQGRGENRYGVTTYRMCLRCRKRQKVKSFDVPNWKAEWEDCEPMTELDEQFDENDNYIFSSQKL